MPVGICVTRTALSVVLTCCPPAPLARYTSAAGNRRRGRCNISGTEMCTSISYHARAISTQQIHQRLCRRTHRCVSNLWFSHQCASRRAICAGRPLWALASQRRMLSTYVHDLLTPYSVLSVLDGHRSRTCSHWHTLMRCSASNLMVQLCGKQIDARALASAQGTLHTHRNLENASLPVIRLIISLKPSVPHPVSARAAEMGSRRHPFATLTLTQVSPVSCGADRELNSEQ